MPISLDQLVDAIEPSKTILLLGSGSSIPSGAPSVEQIRTYLANQYHITSGDLSLPELAAIVEKRHNRKKLVSTVRELFLRLEPTGGLLNLPRLEWKSLYTTNYDNLIELAYKRMNATITVYSSNFDFGTDEIPNAVRLMKLHGSIDKDVCDGNKSRIIVTENDFDLAGEYRRFLFDSLARDLVDGDLVIIGHSLSDPDIKTLISKSLRIDQSEANIGSIYLFMYESNEERAELIENRGVKVCFGGIDEFFSEVARKPQSSKNLYVNSSDPIDVSVHLSPITINVAHSIRLEPKVSEMFNGWPASYGDIASGHTFDRSVATNAENLLLQNNLIGCVLLGAGGVGKTTAARQIVYNLNKLKFFAWEHKSDFTLITDDWVSVAKKLQSDGNQGVILIDDCDGHLYEINALFDSLAKNELTNFHVILTSSPSRWNPRVKSPALFSNAKILTLGKLNKREINDLVNLTKYCHPIRDLVDSEFLDFSEDEQRRRLFDRCERDMFVCLKNIFASEKFDDILLREYASLPPQYQEIYKLIAALESSGVRVHRQLIIRLLGIEPISIGTVLDNLMGIVCEYTVNSRDGIYGWRGRHSVITDIITKYKYSQSGNFVDLFEKVIGALNPTFDIEIRTLRELSSLSTGIRRIPDRKVQNRLLAKMISVAPGERVPRHRLVQNLIEMREFERAEAEIRLFTKDFGGDGPIFRYRIILTLARAKNVSGLLEEDRLVILDQARDLAIVGVGKFPVNKNMLYTYCDVGLEIYKRTNSKDVFDDALSRLKGAEETVGDPDISQQISRYERRLNN